MSPNPVAFLCHLRAEGYHSRSNKHSNALAEAVVSDLLAGCPVMADRARRGLLVYDLNFTIHAGTSDWNVDLVLGAPPPGSACAEPAGRSLQVAAQVGSYTAPQSACAG